MGFCSLLTHKCKHERKYACKIMLNFTFKETCYNVSVTYRPFDQSMLHNYGYALLMIQRQTLLNLYNLTLQQQLVTSP